MEVTGRYINLARAADRRAHMQAQLERFGCADRYTRFDAIEGDKLSSMSSPLSPGELGCFMSHYNCLAQTQVSDREHLHVTEDDVVFGPQTVPLIGDIPISQFGEWDILFTDVIVPFSMNAIYSLLGTYRKTGLVERRLEPPSQRMPQTLFFPDLRNIGYSGSASYIVNQASIPKVLRLLEREIGQGLAYPIDRTYRLLSERDEIRAYCTIPFLTTVDSAGIGQTTISGMVQDEHSAMALYLLRSFFFVGKDEPELLHEALSLCEGITAPGYAELILEVLRFVFSDRFVAV